MRYGDLSGTAAPRRRPQVELFAPRRRGCDRLRLDAGYAFLLAHCLEAQLVLGDDEHPEDARCAVVTVGVRRAGLVGRAPLAADVDLGRALLGYDGDAPRPFVEWRTHRLWGIARDPGLERWLGELVEESLHLHRPDPPSSEQIARWWDCVGATAPSGARPT
jgi:hypothetical protein